MYLFCPAGEEDGNREARESEMDGQGEKTRHNTVGPDDWDGPSKRSLNITFLESHLGPSEGSFWAQAVDLWPPYRTPPAFNSSVNQCAPILDTQSNRSFTSKTVC